MHDRRPLPRQQGRQRDIANDPPQTAADQRRQPIARRRLGADGLVEQQRVGDAIAGVGVDDEPLLVRGDDLFRRRLDIEQAFVESDDVLDERPFDVQAGGFHDLPRLSELQHQRLFGLVDDEQRVRHDDGEDDQRHGEQDQSAAAHCAPPGTASEGGAAGAGAPAGLGAGAPAPIPGIPGSGR